MARKIRTASDGADFRGVTVRGCSLAETAAVDGKFPCTYVVFATSSLLPYTHFTESLGYGPKKVRWSRMRVRLYKLCFLLGGVALFGGNGVPWGH